MEYVFPKKRGLVEKWIRPKNVELCKYHATINVKMNIYALNTHIWQSNRIHVLNKADQENICYFLTICLNIKD